MTSGSGPPNAPLRRDQRPRAPSFHLLLRISHGRDAFPRMRIRKLRARQPNTSAKIQVRLAAESDARLPQRGQTRSSGDVGLDVRTSRKRSQRNIGERQKAQQQPANAPNGIVTKCPERDYSGLMFANLITLAHFSVSSAISFPKFAGGPGSTVPPRAANRAFAPGSARIALISLLSRSMISGGVALGALMPKKALAS